MTRTEFLSAAAKGQGRAILSNRDVAPPLHDLRRLVLRWPGFDWQFETSRGWYSVELMESSPYKEELANLVVRHLARTKGPARDLAHREAIVLEMAKRGHSAARDAVYSHFDPSDDFRLARKIIDLDCLEGLDWVISHSVGYFAPEEAWQFNGWIEDLSEALGADVVSQWLAREAATRPEVSEFARVAALKPVRQMRPERGPIPYEAFRQEWLDEMPDRMSPGSWARLAPEVELEKAWHAFESEADGVFLRKLAFGLRNKAKHRNVERLTERAWAWDDEQNPFVKALDGVVDSRVRQLGFDLISAGWVVDGVDLVATNAQPGDESALASAASSLTDEGDIHSVGLDLLRLPPELDVHEILIWVYERTPCSFCREGAARRLIEKREAPEWILRECLMDCVLETRQMAAKTLVPSTVD